MSDKTPVVCIYCDNKWVILHAQCAIMYLRRPPRLGDDIDDFEDIHHGEQFMKRVCAELTVQAQQTLKRHAEMEELKFLAELMPPNTCDVSLPSPMSTVASSLTEYKRACAAIQERQATFNAALAEEEKSLRATLMAAMPATLFYVTMKKVSGVYTTMDKALDAIRAHGSSSGLEVRLVKRGDYTLVDAWKEDWAIDAPLAEHA